MASQFWDYQEQISYSKEKANKVNLGGGEQSRMTLWCLLPGQQIKPHVHAGDHYWVILEGSGEYLQEGEDPVPVAPGQLLLALTGASHGILNNGDTGLVFVSVTAG